MDPLGEAIANFRAAVGELAKRNRGRGVGSAVGAIVGSGTYPLKRTEAQIDFMTYPAELEAWVDAVELSPPSSNGGEGG